MADQQSIKRGVSLYSYQEEYCYGKMSLEDCLSVTNNMGIEGIEIVSDQMIHGNPFPQEGFYENWRGWIAKYHLTPVCNDIFINTNLYKNRNLTLKESIQALTAEIKHTCNLGCHKMRLVSNTPVGVVESCLSCAEDNDVVMALEVHAGLGFGNPYTRKFIDVMLDRKSPYLGLVPDMGLFCRKFPRVVKYYYVRRRANPRLADYMVEAYDAGDTAVFSNFSGKIPGRLMKFNPGPDDMEFIFMMGAFENNDVTLLKEFIPHTVNVHAKFYEMTEDCVEYSIPYDEIIAFFGREGYTGYLCSEYEGNRFIHDAFEVDSVEQVRRHQVMMKRYIDGKERSVNV